MSVKHAVLGLVIERPGYGYELIQRLGDRIGGWRPSTTAVYPTLRLLNREGLIRIQEEPVSHREVVWYEATEDGIARFREWMEGPSELMPLREELLVKLAFAGPRDLPRLIEVTRELERSCLDRLMTLRDDRSIDELLAGERDWPELAALLLRDAEMLRVQATLTSLQRCRAAMKRVVRRGEEAEP